MPVAAKQFLLADRLLQPGEAFELPSGVTVEALQAEGLVAAEDTAEAEPAEPAEPEPPRPRRPRRKRATFGTADA